MSDLGGGRSRSRKGAVLLVATDIPEERDCLCKWGASWGLTARAISSKAFARSMGDESEPFTIHLQKFDGTMATISNQ